MLWPLRPRFGQDAAMRTTIFSLLAALALGTCGCRDNPRAIIADLGSRYRSAVTYADEGRVRVTETRGGATREFTLPFQVAFARPDRVRIEAYDARIVADGTTFFAAVGSVPDTTVPPVVTNRAFSSGSSTRAITSPSKVPAATDATADRDATGGWNSTRTSASEPRDDRSASTTKRHVFVVPMLNVCAVTRKPGTAAAAGRGPPAAPVVAPTTMSAATRPITWRVPRREWTASAQ